MATDPSLTISDDDINQSVAVLLEHLPAPVRAFVKSQERTDIALALSQKYRLHADQAGVFEQSFLYMLLGVSDPKEFVADLREAGISEEAVAGLANDLNEQVFKPLRREEEQVAAPAAPPPPPPPSAPAPPPPPPPPPVAPAEPMRTMGTDMAHVQAGYQMPYPQQPMYPSVQQVQYVPFGYAPIPMQQPGGYWVPVVLPQQQPVYPPQMQQPVPPSPPPPPPAPVVVPATPPPPPPPPVFEREVPPPPPNLPTMEVSPTESADPLKKEYGVDPYREPFS